MNNFTTDRFTNLMDSVRTHATELKANVQELLIMACFFAFKDGNTTPLNTILDMALNTKAIDTKRITRWVELHAGIARIVKEQFVLNKKVREESCVTNEESFAEIEKVLRTVAWYDILKQDKAASVFDVESKIESLVKQILKHKEDPDADVEMLDRAAKELKAVKGKLAMFAIADVSPSAADQTQQ